VIFFHKVSLSRIRGTKYCDSHIDSLLVLKSDKVQKSGFSKSMLDINLKSVNSDATLAHKAKAASLEIMARTCR
jgi:hypothetical protein